MLSIRSWATLAERSFAPVEQFLPIPQDIGEHLFVDMTSPSLLRWKNFRGNHVKEGAVAGTLRPDGRWRVSYKKRFYYTYRIYIFLSTGKDIGNLLVDHKNNNSGLHDPSNLRVATRSQNNANRKPRFKYKGISPHAKTGLWRARICANGKEITSYHTTDIEAARAYDVMALKVHGEFAYLNFPEDTNVHP